MKNVSSTLPQTANEIQVLRKVVLFLLKRELAADAARLKQIWPKPWLLHRIDKTKKKMELLGYNPDVKSE